MLVKAYAKINLLLDVVGTLENGYHAIFSVMQSVSLCDLVFVTRNSSGKITLECAEKGVPEDERNIAYKAAMCFFDYFDIDDRGVHIKIEKHIPHEAGLAGGSADGAAVIRALSKLYSKKIRQNELVRIALRVGADVPFCLFGGTALVQNMGEVISFLPDIHKGFIVIAKPVQSVRTDSAYAAYDKAASSIRHLDKQGMLQAVLSEDMNRICSKCDNVFEQFVEVCDRAHIKSVMRKHGAKAACMSGSGPSVFGIFENEKDANKACDELKAVTKEVYVCTPVGAGCEIAED